MNINDAFPSNYLKSSDLKGTTPTVTMSHVISEQLGDDRKLVLYFQNKEKGMVLNKTNANNIASIYGPETEGWTGKKVMLAVAWVDFQGRSVEAIRVRPPAHQPSQTEQNIRSNMPSSQPDPRPSEMADLDDEIPF
jgi:hypothetical protein